MSAVKIDTTHLNIASVDVVNVLIAKKHYTQTSKEVLTQIALDIVEAYKKMILDQKSTPLVFDDEKVFDDIFDGMLNRLDEVFSSADIAYLVNDVLIQLEDILFDEGCIEYYS